jgi:hypothetical protein
MSVCCGCCVPSGRGLCGGLITRPEMVPNAVCVSVIPKTQQREGIGPTAVKPWGNSATVDLFDACIEHL